MEYSVLNPRGEIDPIEYIALQPRVKDLNGKTIGLFAYFKKHWVLILDEVERQLKARYPSARFTRFQYIKDPSTHNTVAEIAKDPEVRPQFEEWLKGVDCVVSANGDAGSCALYLAYNTSLVERLGKPAVNLINKEFINITKSAISLRGVPNLRYVVCNVPDLSMETNLERAIKEIIPPRISAVLDDIVKGLTSPLNAEDKSVQKNTKKEPRIVCQGSLEEINSFYYRKGSTTCR